MFELTAAAARQILASAEQSGAAQLCLRVAARRAADGDLQYGLGFDEPKDEDVRLDLHGVAVILGAESFDLLQGTRLDFVEMQPEQFNFVFIPPGHPACGGGAVSAGGCGGGGCAGCSSQGAGH